MECSNLNIPARVLLWYAATVRPKGGDSHRHNGGGSYQVCRPRSWDFSTCNPTLASHCITPPIKPKCNTPNRPTSWSIHQSNRPIRHSNSPKCNTLLLHSRRCIRKHPLRHTTLSTCHRTRLVTRHPTSTHPHQRRQTHSTSRTTLLFLATLRFCVHYCIDRVLLCFCDAVKKTKTAFRTVFDTVQKKNPRFARFFGWTVYQKIENDLGTRQSNKCARFDDADINQRTRT